MDMEVNVIKETIKQLKLIYSELKEENDKWELYERYVKNNGYISFKGFKDNECVYCLTCGEWNLKEDTNKNGICVGCTDSVK